MELVNIFIQHIALLECKAKTKTKKTKDIDEKMLTKNSDHNNKDWGYNEKFCLITQKGMYPYEYIDGQKNFKEAKLPPKKAFYNKLSMKRKVIMTMKTLSKSGILQRKRAQVAITTPT